MQSEPSGERQGPAPGGHLCRSGGAVARVDARWAFAWPLLSGLALATVWTLRTESVPLLLSAALSYAGLRGFSRVRRGALVAVLLASFVLGALGLKTHFRRQEQHAGEVIGRHGGHPYPGGFRLGHPLWHPIWCGLGDFGGSRGYEWRDEAALDFARPVLEAQGLYVPREGFDSEDPRDYLDPDTRIYKRFPYAMPEYSAVLRDKVLTEIASDPLWYLGVIQQRIERIFTEFTPLRIAGPRGWFGIGLAGFDWRPLYVIPLVLFLGLVRRPVACSAPLNIGAISSFHSANESRFITAPATNPPMSRRLRSIFPVANLLRFHRYPY